MARVAGVDGQDLAADDLAGWMFHRPELAAGMGALSDAVYDRSQLPLREREIARMRIAEANGCEVCRNARDALGPSNGVDDELYTHILDWRTWPGYSDRERLAAEFAERFVGDHHRLREDDDFWARLHDHFDDGEIVDLGMCCALWLGTGRLMRTMDVAQACSLVFHQTDD